MGSQFHTRLQLFSFLSPLVVSSFLFSNPAAAYCDNLSTNGWNSASHPSDCMTEILVIGYPSQNTSPGPIIVDWGPAPGPRPGPGRPSPPKPSPESPPRPSPEKEKEKDKEECLDDMKIEHSMCLQTAAQLHVHRFRSCEILSWMPWGLIGSPPISDSCSKKLELQFNSEVGSCNTDHLVNKKLCGL